MECVYMHAHICLCVCVCCGMRHQKECRGGAKELIINLKEARNDRGTERCKEKDRDES